ncbi:MAG TPA: GNAT family N-acetyltransferase [Gammaproteobacteria bacterium]|jgi:GNAT superfamily N-acetyltransferase
MAPVIRRVSGDDAPALAGLVAEHAGYERSEARPEVTRLSQALSAGRLTAWMAEADGEPVGYAAVTEDFSTWRSEPFLHLDCLFVRERYRGRGLGAALFRQAERHARESGVSCLEWQTPSWNADAIRFYERLGARYALKARFILGRAG